MIGVARDRYGMQGICHARDMCKKRSGCIYIKIARLPIVGLRDLRMSFSASSTILEKPLSRRFHQFFNC